MSDPRFQGAYTALVTPFTSDASSIDFKAYEKLLEDQIANGISGLVPCGTTGESATQSDAEQRELIQFTAKYAAGRVPVIAGTGSNSTKKTIDASKAALEAGADGVMVVMPYYNKPSQEGLLRHVELIAAEIKAPIILYNVPGRSAVDLSVETTLRILDKCPQVAAVKDASGNLFYCQELLLRAGNRVAVFCGDDPLTLPMLSVGAIGVISVTSNLYPKQVGEVVTDALAGRYVEARKKHLRLFPVHRALFLEPSPAPVKAALASKGRLNPSVRSPIVEVSPALEAKLREIMANYEASA